MNWMSKTTSGSRASLHPNEESGEFLKKVHGRLKDLDGRQPVWRARYGEIIEPVKSVLWLRRLEAHHVHALPFSV